MSATKMASFRNCPLAFRFTAVEKLPEPPTLATLRGTIVHRALEFLYSRTPQQRDGEAAREATRAALEEGEADMALLDLSASEQDRLRRDVGFLVGRCFEIEDPHSVSVVGTEIRLETTIANVRFRGVIDRLDRNASGDLVVTDYKTGRSPSPNHEQASLTGVQIYSLMCEERFGSRPALLQLYFLKEPMVLSAYPTDQRIAGLERKVRAAWTAISRACEKEDFRPRPSALCSYCTWKEFCPAFGGNPDAASDSVGAPRLALHGS